MMDRLDWPKAPVSYTYCFRPSWKRSIPLSRASFLFIGQVPHDPDHFRCNLD
jgi:hypothetical protein